MPLPVLSGSSALGPADLVRLFHQSELDWCRHLGEETTLDAGTRISNLSLPSIEEANCFVDARLLPGITPAALFDQIQSSAIPCRRWTLNPSAPLEQTSSLAQYLLDAGGSKSIEDILILRKQQTREISVPDLTVIPARASFSQYRRLMHARAIGSNNEAVEAEMLHLDDSHFDALLAIQNREPIASLGMLTSGEVGTLRHWFVAPPHRNRGIGRFMLNRVLELCGRAGFRHVMAGVPKGSPCLSMLTAAGFGKVGEREIFHTRSTLS